MLDKPKLYVIIGIHITHDLGENCGLDLNNPFDGHNPNDA
jgi:hypothetical protein